GCYGPASKYQKKTRKGGSVLVSGWVWCGREDSNFHGISPTSTSSLRVYQFRHDRNFHGPGAWRLAFRGAPEYQIGQGRASGPQPQEIQPGEPLGQPARMAHQRSSGALSGGG